MSDVKTKDERKALGILRASIISDQWPEMNCSYFNLPTWAQEYVDMVIGKTDIST